MVHSCRRYFLRQVGVIRAVQVAPVPAGKSASDAPACAPGIEGAGHCFRIPDEDSPVENGGAAASWSEGAMEDQDVGPTQSKGGVAAASRPPYIRRVGVDGFASGREWQVDVEPH